MKIFSNTDFIKSDVKQKRGMENLTQGYTIHTLSLYSKVGLRLAKCSKSLVRVAAIMLCLMSVGVGQMCAM